MKNNHAYRIMIDNIPFSFIPNKGQLSHIASLNGLNSHSNCQNAKTILITQFI